ncbi:MAG: c-type cytochrome [Gammaproteobacteria bacterium]|nr:MAG: c-type cytochrome [Gammaproteobacteria bacterium]
MSIKGLTGLLIAAAIMSFAPASFAADDVASIARGGRLYDKWFKVIGAPKPAETHPAWPSSNTAKKGNTTHRCKSCHGWDMMGKDGAYASGSYKTGIPGLKQMAGKSNDKVIAALKDSTHGFGGKMSEQDFTDLANFVTKGQIDIDAVIERKSKKAQGDSAAGGRYYQTVCAGCHGETGLEPKDMPPLGKLANKNPWEIIQKTLNGQPDEPMPAMRAFDLQVSVDILSYLQTLPKE